MFYYCSVFKMARALAAGTGIVNKGSTIPSSRRLMF
jgi:hypothetical protein